MSPAFKAIEENPCQTIIKPKVELLIRSIVGGFAI
jgi:hypothetical protein